jgi:hypothetical protein
MGLVKPLESGTTSSRVVDNHKTINSRDLFSSTKDTYTNRDAISSEQYPDTLNTLLARVSGIRATVEYYKKRHSFINNQLGATSFSLEENAVHNSYDLIHMFELVLKEQITIEQNQDNGEFEGSGTAYIYPGFKPHVGDIFLLTLLDSQIGVFVVDNVTKLSISRSAYYEVTFVLYSYTTQDILDKLDGSVRDELFFNKDKYFNDTVTILTDTTYNQLTFLQDIEKKITDYYIAKFYNRDIHSFVSPEGVYDPNIVNMMFNIIETDINIYQIAGVFSHKFKNTIWYSMLHRSLVTLMYNSFVICGFRNYAWDTYLSRAMDYSLLIVKDTDLLKDKRLLPEETSYSYIFSNRFYFAINYYFNNKEHITDLSLYEQELLDDIDSDDPTFSTNKTDTTYLTYSNQYVSLTDILTMTMADGLNNDMRLSDLEYIVYRYLTVEELNIQDLIDIVLKQFPFKNMVDEDKFKLLPVVLLLTKLAINKVK